ncbi:MAG: ABC transporter substrate binding protein [Pseudomonadota bacterium]
MNKLTVFFFFIATLLLTNIATANNDKTLTIGILAPVEINAMNDIINGFKTQVLAETKDAKSSLYGYKVKFIVKNAQGDINIQHSLLQQFNNNSNINIVAPIGTNPMRMAMTLVKNKPILAIDPTDAKTYLTKGGNNDNVTYNYEDIEPAKQIAFIRQVMVNKNKAEKTNTPFTHMAFVYSSDERIFIDAKKVSAAVKQVEPAVIDGETQQVIQLQSIQLQRLSDIIMDARAIKPNNQAIFILEDEPVVDGVNSLIQQAEKMKIPVIASDNGSVQSGAAFALGISQTNVGKSAGSMVAEIVKNNYRAKDVKPLAVSNPTVYINPNGAVKQGIQPDYVKAAAKKFKYPVVVVSGK